MPRYHSDEIAFAKLWAPLRNAAERSVEELLDTIGKLANFFGPATCTNYFADCGYEPD